VYNKKKSLLTLLTKTNNFEKNPKKGGTPAIENSSKVNRKR